MPTRTSARRRRGADCDSKVLNAAMRNFHRFVDEQITALTVEGGPDCVDFPAGLTSEQARHVRHVCSQYGFAFGFLGEGNERHPVVYQPGTPGAPRPEDLNIKMSWEESLSRMLTSILRHRAPEFGLEITEEGYIRLGDVLALEMFASAGFVAPDVEALVARSDQKRRFTLAWWAGEPWIRANQGHTIRTVQDEMLLETIASASEIPCCVHGTYLYVWDQILESGGLSRMTRNHIHFAPLMPGADGVISGMRSDCEVAICVSAASAMAAGSLPDC